MNQHIRIHKTEPNVGVWDFSNLLDAPAGKHGFVQVKGEHLYFEDGTRARFLGFNVAARSNTPDHETADRLAERFASMGVNVIRLHAADAPISDEPGSWASCREAPLLDYDKGTSRKFNPVGLDRFDYFAAKLKEKGIYLHIDLVVARHFVSGDELDYPGDAGTCLKRYPMYNKRLIALQKEYAQELLCHVNPYTGLALKDDPAVMTVQINNEESAIKGSMENDWREEMKPYQAEVRQAFGQFLLDKYHTREALQDAWTYDGVCALGEDEDPSVGTVRVIPGSFYQPENDPMSDWHQEESPARYADFMEFGIQANRQFYQMMYTYLRELGVRVPINTSNLVCGAADVYGHIDGDVMENNTYFNHPMLPCKDNTYRVAGPVAYAATDPLTVQFGIGSMGTTLLSLASVAIVSGKPFVISEWNDYGLHPFHSTSFVHTVAYACLNDWDGLILYNHHTSEKWDDQPADEILNIFDAYNDPALICQWGFMASMFLKGLVSPALHTADVAYTQNDLLTLPTHHSMPTTLLPYIMKMRNVFSEKGETYHGQADVAINGGFTNTGDLSRAKHAVYYSWCPWQDAMRHHADDGRLSRAANGTEEIQPGIHLGKQALVIDDIRSVAAGGNFRHFAELMDHAMKSWGVLPEDTGYVNGQLISDTKELCFDPQHSRFWIHAPNCSYFSGVPEEVISLNDAISVACHNENISISLLPVKENEYLLTAMGKTGMDETEYKAPDLSIGGYPMTTVILKGKLYAETLEGTISVHADAATLEILDATGHVLAVQEGVKEDGNVVFHLDGSVPGVQYHLLTK